MDESITTIFGSAATALGDAVVDVATVALPVAATILAITVGWRYLKGFIAG